MQHAILAPVIIKLFISGKSNKQIQYDNNQIVYDKGVKCNFESFNTCCIYRAVIFV